MAIPQLVSRGEVVPSDVVTSHHQGAILTVVAAFCTVTSFLFLCARLLVRWPWKSLFGKDDWATITATALAVAQVVVTCEAVHQGLGTLKEDIDAIQVSRAQKLTYTADLLFILATYASKFAVAMFLGRLSGSRTATLSSQGIAVACGVFCVTSILVLGIVPPLSMPWAELTSNIRLYRWIAMEIMSNLVDLAIIGFPIYLVADLQMKASTKAKVIIGFALRCFLIPISVERLISLAKISNNYQDTALFDYITPEIYLQVEMCYSIVSTTMPCLRIFLEAASAGRLMEPIIDATDTRLATAGGRYGRSYAYGSNNSGQKTKDRSGPRSRAYHEEPIQLTDRKKYGETVANATTKSRDGATDDVASDSSQRAIMVRHTVTIQRDGEL